MQGIDLKCKNSLKCFFFFLSSRVYQHQMITLNKTQSKATTTVFSGMEVCESFGNYAECKSSDLPLDRVMPDYYKHPGFSMICWL